MTEKRRFYEYIAGLCRAMTLLVTALFVFIPVSTKAQITDYGYSNGKPTEQHSIFFAPQVKEELRAVWLTTVMGLDWPKTYANSPATIAKQKKELTDILDKYVEANINTVLLQTRIRGSVIYPSKIEPWDDCLTGTAGKSPGYDPLAFAIEECHKRGLELHTWLVSIPLGKVQKQRSFGRQSITKKRPELCKTAGGEIFMIPGKEETADYIAEICREITQNYDIDGIQLDYIRYPEKLYRFSDDNLYKRSSGLTKNEWKRENITRIVRKVNKVVKAIKPWVKLSSSPIGKYSNLSRYNSGGWNCFNGVYQDPQAWLRDNLQDFLCPMMYFIGDNFYPYLFDWKEHSYGHPVAPGLGIYFLDPSEGKWTLNDVRAEMHSARNIGIGGIAFYRSEFLTRNIKGLYNTVCNEFFLHPALTPRMAWANDTIAPLQPTGLRNNGKTLNWTSQEATDTDGGILFNVYASATYPVDITRAENLIAPRLRKTSFDIIGLGKQNCYFAVTSSDRYGNESAALQEEAKHVEDRQSRDKELLKIDDNGLIHFENTKQTIAVYICDLAGKKIRIATSDNKIRTHGLEPGWYKLTRIMKKNSTQTIGIFKIDE